jgi:aspartate aminotransferase, mitochondrial
MDPNIEQWKQISEIMKDRNLLPFFDCAYQGFASGSADKDAEALRLFAEDGHLMCMIQSFSKSFGLYGHRVGTLSVVGANEEEAKRVVSQLKVIIRPMYSNPPIHGARIVSTILTDPKLREDWKVQCAGMADRINTMRTVLRDTLADLGSTRNWNHIIKQASCLRFTPSAFTILF